MTKHEKITQSIFEVIDDLNPLLPAEQQLEKSPDTVLLGEAGKLDSLGLVNFIVATEQKIEEEFEGATVTLADTMALSPENSPLATIGTLVEYLSTLLEQEAYAQTNI